MANISDNRAADLKPDAMLPFTVASALLRELGERLVGQAHIALAELVKNSYDADATKVEIKFEPDRIVIEDNGHGMDRDEFENFWMRIGTAHKQEKGYSRYFKRPLTGSKGVGRLAVQFLARKVDLYTVSKGGNDELHASVNWDAAVEVGELTEAKASLWFKKSERKFPDGKAYGTRIELTRLEHSWAPASFSKLAREIWFLEPPIRKLRGVEDKNVENGFEVELTSNDSDAEKKFKEQMSSILRIWHAKINGKISGTDSINGKGLLKVVLAFPDGESHFLDYPIDSLRLHQLDYEIRIFQFEGRLRSNIPVDIAREYMEAHGGVHIYDSGFNLPYYGVDSDWLGIEKAHARRQTISTLLPEELRSGRMEGYIPTNRRIFGVAHVNTGIEGKFKDRSRDDILQIQVSRDRLVSNGAYEQLQKLVRVALDFYAIHESRRAFEKNALRWDKQEPVPTKIRRVEDVLESYEKSIPKDVYESLSLEVTAAVEASQTEAERTTQQLSLLGTLATAGIAALAAEHQAGQQLALLEGHISRIKQLSNKSNRSDQELVDVANDLSHWLERERATRALFTTLMDQESREQRLSLRVKPVIETVISQVRPLMRGVSVDIDEIDENMRMPVASQAEWSAIFQNVFINAVNALLDSELKLVRVRSRIREKRYELIVEDTGAGVDLKKAEKLFEPFSREMKISAERKALGLGGTGLGLTIVKMLAEKLGCSVSFVAPSDQFNTAFLLSWEKK